MDELEKKENNLEQEQANTTSENLEREQKESEDIRKEEIQKEESKKPTEEVMNDAEKSIKIEDSTGEHSFSEEKKEEPKVEDKKPEVVPKSKEGSYKPLVFVMIASLLVAFFWDKIPFIKDAVHFVLDPSAGVLLNWNLTVGMLLIVLIISLFTTLVQKYATDQKALKELRKEQKILQDEMKKYKEHPEKVAELSKKQFEFFPKTFKLTSRAMMFTGIPFILFFRWFNDFFGAIDPEPVFFGFLSWFWFYLIFVMIFSGFLRKWLNVV